MKELYVNNKLNEPNQGRRRAFKNLLILVKLGSGVDDELAKIVHNDRFQMCKFPFYIIGPHPILTQVIFELFALLQSST